MLKNDRNICEEFDQYEVPVWEGANIMLDSRTGKLREYQWRRVHKLSNSQNLIPL
jgi:hypothetical protein